MSESFIRKVNPVDQFSAHLDACKQRREHPIQLCKIGTVLPSSAGCSRASPTWKRLG